MYTYTILSSLFLFINIASAQQQSFRAQILYSEPSMNGGALQGTMTYAWTYSNTPSYFMDFSSQVYSVLYQYNYQNGYYITNGQWRYRYGPGCPGGCETGAILEGMPKFFLDNSYDAVGGTRQIAGQFYQVYLPKNSTNNPVARLIVGPLSLPAASRTVYSAEFTNGNKIVFQSFSPIGDPTVEFTPKDGCSCGKPIDVSLVIDRSGSITVSQFSQFVSFLNDFIRSFKINPNQTQIAITTFNTKATKVLDLSSSFQAVSGSINGMSCVSSKPNDSCQVGGTSISAGIQVGAERLIPARPWATHVVILLTDGAHNTLSDAQSTWCYQYCGLNDTVSPVYDTCGDANKNYIPDQWEIGKRPQDPWSPMSLCYRDLLNAREYAFKLLGEDLIIFAMGIGNAVAQTELTIVTDNMYKLQSSQITCSNFAPFAQCLSSSFVPCGGAVTPACYAADNTNPERVLLSTNWDTLGSKLLELTSKVCDVNDQPCGQCCGYCKCGQCSRADVCIPPNYCDAPKFVGPCCSSEPRVCNASSLCMIASCNRNANNGQGACQERPVSCGAETVCYRYQCNPANGGCDRILKAVPPSGPCFISDCINGQLFNNTPKNCSGPNACLIYECDASTGNCITRPRAPASPPPNCLRYECDPNDYDGDPFYLVNITCPPNSDQCLPVVCNPSNGRCEISPVICRNQSDLCDITECDSSTGRCLNKTFKTCTAPNCQVNCTCVPETGNCRCENKVCPKIDCWPRRCNILDGNCTSIVTGNDCCPIDCSVPPYTNRCYLYDCNRSKTEANCDLVTYIGNDCKDHLTDFCLINPRCDNNTGCAYDEKHCPPAEPCFDLVRNSSDPNCCTYFPRNCPTDPCNVPFCDPTLNRCSLRPKCFNESDAPNRCLLKGCLPNGTCWENNVICTSDDLCKIPLPCDPVNLCVTVPKDCDDKNPCTDDSCEAGQCVHKNITCLSTPCQIFTCDVSSGSCIGTPVTCNDNNKCTNDFCNDSAIPGSDPCVYVPINATEKCNDNNLCTNDTCVPTLGCVNIPYDVSTYCPVGNKCQRSVCTPTFGCQTLQRQCVLVGDDAVEIESSSNQPNATNQTDCSYAVCHYNDTAYECVKQELNCAVFSNTILIPAIVLGVGAIVGIVVGVVACIGLSGASSYAAFKWAGSDIVSNVQVNPLYEGNAKGGENPLSDR